MTESEAPHAPIGDLVGAIAASSHKHVHSCPHKHGKGTFARKSFWNLSCTCIFSAVPDEILLFNVFTFLSTSELSRISSVSSRWRFLASDRVLWSRLDLSKYGAAIDDAVLSSILKRFGNNMLTLKLCNLNRLTAASLEEIGSRAKNLRELHLCNLKAVTDAAVVSVAEHCAHLEHASLFGCARLTDRGVGALVRACPRLEEVSLRNVTAVTAAALDGFGGALRGLNLSGCRSVDGRAAASLLAASSPALERLNAHGVPRLDDGAVDRLARACPRLSALHLSSGNPFGGSSPLTDAALVAVARLADLRTLNLQGASLLTDAGLVHLAASSPRLQRLNLGGCYRLTGAGVARAAQLCGGALTHLSVFQLLKLSDAALLEIAARARLLVQLDAHGCPLITRAGLLALAEPVAVAAEAKSEHAVADACAGAAGQPQPLPQQPVPALEQLDVSGCRSLRAADVDAFRALRPRVQVVFY